MLHFSFNLVLLIIATHDDKNMCDNELQSDTLTKYVTVAAICGLCLCFIELYVFFVRNNMSFISTMGLIMHCGIAMIGVIGYIVCGIYGAILFNDNMDCTNSSIGIATIFTFLPFNVMFTLINERLFTQGITEWQTNTCMGDCEPNPVIGAESRGMYPPRDVYHGPPAGESHGMYPPSQTGIYR